MQKVTPGAASWSPAFQTLCVALFFLPLTFSARDSLKSLFSKQTLSIKGKIHDINSFYKHFLLGSFTARLIRQRVLFCFSTICRAREVPSNVWPFLDMVNKEICYVALGAIYLGTFTSGLPRLCSSWRLIHMLNSPFPRHTVELSAFFQLMRTA